MIKKEVFIPLVLFVFISCERNMRHERYIENHTAGDTITVINPDFDTVYTIYPGESAMIYGYEILDKEQEMEVCRWQGDTLLIKNQLDSLCDKAVSIEENWTYSVKRPEEDRVQQCFFSISDGDF